jgi:DNA-binding winged helix-turn-helix (wHTH) protein
MAGITFGPFTADFEARELRRGRERLHLSPKALQLLEVLIRERPRAIAKTELQDALWPDVFVEESNLADLVSELRRALGQSGKRSGFIRTLHGFGYSFTGDVAGDAPPAAAALPAWLIGWDKGQVEIGEGDFVIGRDPRAAIRLLPSTVSWSHAQIRVRGVGASATAAVEDLASRNGTFVNGERVTGAAEIHDGDELRVGSVRLSVARLHGERRPTDPM